MAALFASPSLFADLIVNVLLIGGLSAIIAMGLNLQYGMLRILNIAHGEFLMIGAFITYTLTVATGTKVTWTNSDEEPHTVTSADGGIMFKSPALDTDEKFSFTFDRPGSYKYFCSIHPHMVGTIVVK